MKAIACLLALGCDVGEARLVYLDSQGERHTLIYQRIGENCNG